MADIEVRMNGQSVIAAPGDRIVVSIPENATTGYQWAIEDVGAPLEVESNELLPAGDARPGSGGMRQVVLRARESGHARVALRLQRAWEAEPIEHMEVNVTVR